MEIKAVRGPRGLQTNGGFAASVHEERCAVDTSLMSPCSFAPVFLISLDRVDSEPGPSGPD